MDLPRNPTRAVRIGSITIGQDHPIAVQSMTATHTTNIDATVQQVNAIAAAGADVIRIAVDSKKDADALPEIRRQTNANLVIDLQENYRMAELVAPYVNKLRYNPGHLYHHEQNKPWQDKVRFLADVAVRRIAPDVARIRRLAAEHWKKLRGQEVVPVAEYMEKLKSRKAEVGEQIDRSRAASRYEAPPPASSDVIRVIDEPLLNPDLANPERPKPAANPAPTTGLAPTPMAAAPESYTNRLLKAKQKVWEDREKEKNKGS